MYTGFDGSLSSFSSCARCLSRGLITCLIDVEVLGPAVVVAGDAEWGCAIGMWLSKSKSEFCSVV